jgi:hypothetical protein
MSKRIPKDPTLQQVYDYVGRHLLRQADKAEGDTSFVLQDRLGRSCALGCLIKPGTMIDVDEDETSPRVRRAIRESFGVDRLYPSTIKLLRSLRFVHDRKWAHQWLPALHTVAIDHGLEPIEDQP